MDSSQPALTRSSNSNEIGNGLLHHGVGSFGFGEEIGQHRDRGPRAGRDAEAGDIPATEQRAGGFGRVERFLEYDVPIFDAPALGVKSLSKCSLIKCSLMHRIEPSLVAH
jgi:hypothetical protein